MKVKFNNPEGYRIEIEGKNWLLHEIFEWSQLFGKYNWMDFHPILIHFMRDIVLPGYELEVAILGIGFRFRVNGDWNKTKEGRDLLKFNPDNAERVMDECPMCDGSGEVGVIRPKDNEA